MDSVAQKSEEQWTCVVCTLLNKPSAKECDACLTSRPLGKTDFLLSVHYSSKRVHYTKSGIYLAPSRYSITE
jgi:hypothetical protein